MDGLHLSLFGPFRATLDGKPVRGFAYDKVRALLVYLAMQSSFPHRRESLATLLWPEQSPHAARASLRKALSTLRKAIQDPRISPPFLLISRETVQFNPASNFWLDAVIVERHLEASASHPHARIEACEACIQALTEAVKLYQGDFLQGLMVRGSQPFEDWVLTHRGYFHSRILMALHHLTRYHTRRGAYDQAHQYALRQIQMEPYREEAHRALIHILARSGQRSAALAQYEACRRILAEELGVEPSRQTQALYRRLRSAGNASPHNLPAELSPLMGRAGELLYIADTLADPKARLLTITGIGGIGKTRLALEAAREQIGVYLHGVYFISLATLRASQHIAVAIAEAVGAPLQGAHAPEAELLAYLREKEMLLVLDSFEHLLDGADLLLKVLKRAPLVNLLVTSQEPLNVQGEHLLLLEGLPYPQDATSPAADSSPAVHLFLNCVRRLQPGFTPTTERLPHVLHICRLTQGIPLAIEMAAAWVRHHPCEQIAREIEADLDYLASARRDLPHRQRSLRAVFEHSWALLTPDEQRIFASLSVFRGTFSARAARAVTGASSHLLTALVSKSLLHAPTAQRYEMHNLLARYAAEKLAADPALQEAARHAHTAYYLHFLQARHQPLRTRRDPVALQELDRELPNLHVAWERAIAQRSWDLIDAALDGLHIFYWARNRFSEGQAAFQHAIQALQADADGHPRLLARLQIPLADFTAWLGDLGAAQEQVQDVISALRGLSADNALREALALQGMCAYWQGHYGTARTALEECLALARCADDTPLIAQALSSLANVLCDQDSDLTAAMPLYAESLTLYQQLGDNFGAAKVLLNQGALLFEQGEMASARELYRAGLRHYREVNYLYGIAVALNNLAMIARKQGNLDEARKLVEEGLHIKQQTGNQIAILYSLLELGALHVAAHEPEPALRTCLEMLQLSLDVQSAEMCAQAVLGLAEAALLYGETTRAATWIAFVCAQKSLGQETLQAAETLRAALPPESLSHAAGEDQPLTVQSILTDATSLHCAVSAKKG